ncbi:hypothetical protein HBB16_20320 [Pseudonocardia sp. MCCB 268]|nr:hypothetical protein [Pseudonocardia cytotoxica]
MDIPRVPGQRDHSRRSGSPSRGGGAGLQPQAGVLPVPPSWAASWSSEAQVPPADGEGRRGPANAITDREVADAKPPRGSAGGGSVTEQVPKGKPVYRVYVEETVDIDRELYFGIVLDRTSGTMPRSSPPRRAAWRSRSWPRRRQGGRPPGDQPATGFPRLPGARDRTFAVGAGSALVAPAATLFPRRVPRVPGPGRDFHAGDQPMVRPRTERLVALDAKMSFDDNATFRHPEIAELRDHSQEDARESYAADNGLSVGLDRTSAASSTVPASRWPMDMIRLRAGEPANFSTSAVARHRSRLSRRFQSVLQDENVGSSSSTSSPASTSGATGSPAGDRVGVHQPGCPSRW